MLLRSMRPAWTCVGRRSDRVGTEVTLSPAAVFDTTSKKARSVPLRSLSLVRRCRRALSPERTTPMITGRGAGFHARLGPENKLDGCLIAQTNNKAMYTLHIINHTNNRLRRSSLPPHGAPDLFSGARRDERPLEDAEAGPAGQANSSLCTSGVFRICDFTVRCSLIGMRRPKLR